MSRLLITNGQIVNENQIFSADILIEAGRITQIAPQISVPSDTQVIDAAGKYVIPGMIDDQVHFREPGFTHKGNIASESAAALAGGTTTIMEMPNVNPCTTTHELLEEKFQRAAASCKTNFSFYLGAANDNLEQIKSLDPNHACGVKVFMGASTGNMLVDDPKVLEQIFQHSPVLIATHCEDTPMISENEAHYRAQYGDEIPFHLHPLIRSEAACYKSSSLAVDLAKRFGTQLHVLHLTTAKELALFTAGDLKGKSITAEVCVHHLFFNDQDYHTLGAQIKCNPAVKLASDQQALIDAVNQDILDIIATDHAPHTWQEKQSASYFKAPSGLPLVQHALPMLFEFYHQGVFSLETIVRKTSHAVADRYQIAERGYIREGYWADLAIVDLARPYTVTEDNILYHCDWSPLQGRTLKSTIDTTIINGVVGYQQGQISDGVFGQRLQFNRG